jgi:hypothetical protein
MRLEFSRQIFGKYQLSSFIKIRPVGAELFVSCGQTDMTKLTVALRTRLKMTEWLNDYCKFY